MVNKRILLVANSDLRYDRRLQRISGSLQKAGYELQLLGRIFSGMMPEEPANIQSLKLWFGKGKLAYLELNIRIFFWLLFRKADAICSVDLDTLPACALAAEWKGCKLIQDSHEYMAEVPEVANRPFTKALWHQVARWFLPGCSLRYTVSNSLADAFLQKYGMHFEVIRNMPSMEESVSDHKMLPNLPDQDYLVYLGAVNQGRGLEEVLAVLAEREENLVIIGEGDKLRVIGSLVESLHLQNRVFFTGKRLPEEIPLLLRRASAGLNLLRDEGLSYRYSLANKFFDYVQAGIPQICIDFPEYQLLMRDYRVGIASGIESGDIHRALDEIKDPLKRKKMQAEASKARLVWNWQEEEKHLIRLYEKLLQ